jgi:hypothetical protein
MPVISPIMLILIATIWNTVWAIAWSRKDAINLLIKIVYFFLAIYGWFIIFKS